ncbi:hypothetical protein HDU78_006920 [Chytriomyces hyalinus]|nr:hypothetical protein HDU78_006920 [Chytriomyces hyalinus]
MRLALAAVALTGLASAASTLDPVRQALEENAACSVPCFEGLGAPIVCPASGVSNPTPKAKLSALQSCIQDACGIRVALCPASFAVAAPAPGDPIVNATGLAGPATSASGVPCVFSSDCKFVLGSWFWHTDMTPARWNRVMGRNYPSFQTDYSIPFDNRTMLNAAPSFAVPGGLYPDPVTLRDVQNAWEDNTTASAFITAYADQETPEGRGLDVITDEWLRYFATFLKKINTDTGRKVYLRWCPEMEGNWMMYGPPYSSASYTAVWRRMYTIMKEVYPEIIIVWAPNYNWPTDVGGDIGHWPGPQYVDVIGSSLYWKGFGKNVDVDATFIPNVLSNLYEYSTRYSKPFIITEGSGAFERDVPTTVDQVSIQRQFWGQILSSAFLDTYPNLQAAYIFDMAKMEEYFRDFKVSNEPVRSMFVGLVDALDAQGRMAWALPRSATATTAASTSAAALETALATATAVASVQVKADVITQTTTQRSAGFTSDIFQMAVFMALLSLV